MQHDYKGWGCEQERGKYPVDNTSEDLIHGSSLPSNSPVRQGLSFLPLDEETDCQRKEEDLEVLSCKPRSA